MHDPLTLTPEILALYEQLAGQYTLARTTTIAGNHKLGIYHPSSVDALLDDEAFNRDGRIPYWSELWASSRVLADRLIRIEGRGQRLLELGCGVGCAAIAASLAGFDVTATDYYSEAFDFVRLNAAANQAPPPQTSLLDWRFWPANIDPYTIVVAADVLYEPQLGEFVADVFRQALSIDGWGLLTDPQRAHAVKFVEVAPHYGLRVTQVESVMIEHRGTIAPVDVYRITHS